MKVGDVIYDAGLGRIGVILEVLEPVEAYESLMPETTMYTVHYDDSHIEKVNDGEIVPIEEML